MRTQSLHIGMQVRHPQHGLGTIKAVRENSAEIQFNDGLRTVAPEQSELVPAEAQASLSGLELPLQQLLAQAAAAIVEELGLERPDQSVQLLGSRWQQGKLVLQPADPSLQAKEVPLEVFFHKIVMVRNNLRVLEQKLNSHPQLTDADKVDLQQYITRSYGSLTTFNVLFGHKTDQFAGSGTG